LLHYFALGENFTLWGIWAVKNKISENLVQISARIETLVQEKTSKSQY